MVRKNVIYSEFFWFDPILNFLSPKKFSHLNFHIDNIYVEKDTVEEINCLQEDLDVLGQYAIPKQIPFNVNKCKVMNIGKKNRKAEYKLINGISTIKNKTEEFGCFFFSDNFK